jgi:hypothetical protein
MFVFKLGQSATMIKSYLIKTKSQEVFSLRHSFEGGAIE